SRDGVQTCALPISAKTWKKLLSWLTVPLADRVLPDRSLQSTMNRSKTDKYLASPKHWRDRYPDCNRYLPVDNRGPTLPYASEESVPSTRRVNLYTSWTAIPIQATSMPSTQMTFNRFPC